MIKQIIPDDVIRRTDHVFFCGRTGSGKTTLMRNLGQTIPYRVVIDTKQDPDDNWYGERVHTLRKLKKVWNKGAIVYQPDKDHMRPHVWEAFFEWRYDTKIGRAHV